METMPNGAVERFRMQQQFGCMHLSGHEARVDIYYGPFPHNDAAALPVELEPRMWQVVWRAHACNDWPVLDSEWFLQQHEVENQRIAIWLPLTPENTTSLVKRLWDIDLPLPSISN